MRGWQAGLFGVGSLIFWSALGYLILSYPPTVPAQALFYILLFLASSSLAVPVLAVLHRAFPGMGGPRGGAAVTLRQGGLVGLFCVGVMLLQALGQRDLVLIVILGTILVLSETFIQQRGG
ncbi:MAG: hypothetical protein Kow0047_32050 [Anaerolineae bacterium]